MPIKVRSFKEIIYEAYKQYYYQLYVSTNTSRGYDYYVDALKTIKKYIYDISDSATLTTIESIELVDLPEQIKIDIQHDIQECININKLRKTSSKIKTTPSCAIIYVIDKHSKELKDKVIGVNHIIDDATPYQKQMIKRYYTCKYVSTVHAELDAIEKIKDKINENTELYILVVRNSGRIFSRPCQMCRNFLKTEFGNYNITLIYPVIGEFIVIEKLGDIKLPEEIECEP